jgi:hypothetical protein
MVALPETEKEPVGEDDEDAEKVR